MQNFIVREFETSDVIFSEGSPGDTAYVLKAGRVEIFTRTNGKKIVLAELTPITIFGEMALLSAEQKRMATARALSYVEVIEIDKTNFDELMADSPTIIVTILHALTQRLVNTTAQLHAGIK